jgi:hypothetical protein
MTDAAVSSAIRTAPLGCDGDRNHAVASTLKNKQERSSRNVGQHSLFHFLVSFSFAVACNLNSALLQKSVENAALNRNLRFPSSHSELRGTVLLNCEELFWQYPI